MVVGFVNARMLALRQAIGAVMGAFIGTTITAWLVAAGLSVKALKISIYALPMIGLGFLLNTAMKRRGCVCLARWSWAWASCCSASV